MSTKILRALDAAGLEAFAPFIRLFRGEDAREQMRKIGLNFGAPLVAFAVFLLSWTVSSQHVMTK